MLPREGLKVCGRLPARGAPSHLWVMVHVDVEPLKNPKGFDQVHDATPDAGISERVGADHGDRVPNIGRELGEPTRKGSNNQSGGATASRDPIYRRRQDLQIATPSVPVWLKQFKGISTETLHSSLHRWRIGPRTPALAKFRLDRQESVSGMHGVNPRALAS